MEFIEFESFIRQSTDYLKNCNEKAIRFFGLGGYGRYEYDLFQNEIWWSDDGDPKVRAKLIIVGSISTQSNTWLWAWANPHFDDVKGDAIAVVRDFGEKNGLQKLVEAKWPGDQIDGWEMTSISARLLEAQGAYYSPNDNGGLFLLFDGLEFIPEEDKTRYKPLKKQAVEAASSPSGSASYSSAEEIQRPQVAVTREIQSNRRIRSVIMVLALLLLFIAAGLTWWAGSELASPTRRPLQDYHEEFLNHVAEHGMVLEKFTLSDGTPCLMCMPEPEGKLGARGRTIREQFASKGLPLPPAGEVHGTLVLAHGRKGRKEDYLPIAERLCAVGFRCLLPDMPAHGDHPATLIYYGVKESGLPALVLKEAAEKFGFKPQPAGLLGMSMGGSVAMHSAGQPDAPWNALAIISSFHAFQPAMEIQATKMAGSLLGKPWAAAAGWVYEWKTGMPLSAIQPHEYAARVKVPTLILHGTDDKIVPIESGRQLFAALPANIEKQWVEIPTADHHNVLITEFPVYATIAEWMLKWVKQGP